MGSWAAEFRLDSTRGRAGAFDRWLAGSFRTARGVFQIRGVLAGRDSTIVLSRLDVDFAGHAGFQLSCLEPLPTTAAVTREDDRVSIAFTPTSTDCGFSAQGRLWSDSLVGTWMEHSFTGPTKLGRFRLTRLKP